MFRYCVVLGWLFIAPALYADNWPQFRGPHFNGSSDEVNLPATWSTTENVVWSADLPGASAATPIIWEDKVFISTTDAQAKTLVAMCLDRRSGDVLWRHTIAKGINRDTRSNFAAPTPATDGEVVVFFYGSGQLVTFDLNGNQRWKRSITKDYGEFAFLWTFSTSPLLYDGRLYLQVLQRDSDVDGRGFTDRVNESYLLALEPSTGEELWRVVRPSKARQESREAFTTPVPFQHDGRDEILIAGGDAITGHDPDTGKELWRWGTWNPERIGHWRLVPSPVAGDGIILACAPKKEPIYALKAGGNAVLSDDALAWTSADARVVSSDVATPAFAHGDFFILNKDRKMLLRVAPQTGEIKWQTERLPGSDDYEASPLVADGKVYIVNHGSRVIVVDAETGEQISDMKMDGRRVEKTRASIVAAHGQLFVRTADKLYCIAKN